MPSADLDDQLAEERLLAALRDDIRTIRRSTGSCKADALTTRLVQQLRGGLLDAGASSAHDGADTTALDVEALASRSYTLKTSISGRSARVTFTAGLADSGIAHGEHLDIRATVSMRHRVNLILRYGLISTDAGANWVVAHAAADRRRLASAEQMLELAGPQVTELVHDPRNRSGLEPVIDAARHVAALRALFDLQEARERLTFAISRTLAARAVLDRYGYTEPDLRALRAHLAHLATEGRALVGW